MTSLFGAPSIPIYYNRPGSSSGVNATTSNTVPTSQDSVIKCWILPVGNARQRFIREQFPGADETYFPVHATPDTANNEWPEWMVKDQGVEGSLTYGGRDAWIQIKIAPLNPSVKALNLQGTFGHKATGMIRYQ